MIQFNYNILMILLTHKPGQTYCSETHLTRRIGQVVSLANFLDFFPSPLSFPLPAIVNKRTRGGEFAEPL